MYTSSSADPDDIGRACELNGDATAEENGMCIAPRYNFEWRESSPRLPFRSQPYLSLPWAHVDQLVINFQDVI